MNRLAVGIACAAMLQFTSYAHAADKVTVAAAFGTIWTAAQPRFCEDRGEFEKAGLDVEYVATRGGSETIQAVISGSADIGYGAGANAVLAGIEKGAKVKIIGGYFTGQSDSFWYVKSDSPIRELDDLDGKTVAFSRPGSVSEQILLGLKNDKNLNFETVPVASLDAAHTMTMTDQVDVGYSIPPSLLSEVLDGKIRVLFDGNAVPRLSKMSARITIASDDFLKSKREVGKRVFEVLNKCIAWMYDNLDEAAPMYGKLNDVSDAIAKEAIKFYPREAMTFLPLQNFDDVIADALATGFIKKMPTAQEKENMIDPIL